MPITYGSGESTMRVCGSGCSVSGRYGISSPHGCSGNRSSASASMAGSSSSMCAVCSSSRRSVSSARKASSNGSARKWNAASATPRG
eukprot:6013107-Prymnesium_polylepis.3